MADQDRHDRSVRSDQEFRHRVEADAYTFLRQSGSDDATARLAAKLAPDQVEIEAKKLAEQIRRVELVERAKQRPTLKLEHQVALWRMRGKGWEDPSQDLAQAQAMYAAGATPGDVLDAQFPYRRDLITRGRPHPRDQVEYAEQMATLTKVIDEAVSAQGEFALSDSPDATFAHGVGLDRAEKLADASGPSVSEEARGKPARLSGLCRPKEEMSGDVNMSRAKLPAQLTEGARKLLALYEEFGPARLTQKTAAERIFVGVRQIQRYDEELRKAGLRDPRR